MKNEFFFGRNIRRIIITFSVPIRLKGKSALIVLNFVLKFHQVSKKHQSGATVLSEGYASHLNILMAHGGSRPAQGNQRMVIPKGCFNLPGQAPSLRRRR